jgi:hypothetical protein
MSNFHFSFCYIFWTPIQNVDSGLFKPEMSNSLYHNDYPHHQIYLSNHSKCWQNVKLIKWCSTVRMIMNTLNDPKISFDGHLRTKILPIFWWKSFIGSPRWQSYHSWEFVFIPYILVTNLIAAYTFQTIQNADKSSSWSNDVAPLEWSRMPSMTLRFHLMVT